LNSREVILVVDDQIPNLDLMAAILKQAGYEVLAATKGEEALERARYAQPDLILLDIVMPDLDGYEVCRKLKENEGTAGIPVLFVSARDETFDLVRARLHHQTLSGRGISIAGRDAPGAAEKP